MEIVADKDSLDLEFPGEIVGRLKLEGVVDIKEGEGTVGIRSIGNVRGGGY